MNQFQLPNGLRVIHKEISGTNLVTMEFFLKQGTIIEKKEQAGLVHFAQQLMSKGTTSRDANRLAVDIENIGAGISMDVDHDYSNVGVSFIDAYKDKATELLADIILHPAFDEKEIAKEKTNIIAAIKRRHDSIFTVTHDALNEAFYKQHPYAWPDIGTIESVSKITKEDLITYHKTYYSAQNMFLVIIGAISLPEARSLAETHFSAIPANAIGFQRPPITDITKQEIVIPTKKFKQAYLMIAYAAPSLDEKEYTTLKVINSILGGRMSARLFMELREKLSLAYEVSSFYPSRKQLSRFVMYIGLKKENVSLAKKRIAEIIDDLKMNEVSDKELLDTINYIRGVYLLDHQTVSKQAWYLGWWEVMGKGYAYDNEHIKDLESVTPKDIRTVANKYFNNDYVRVEVLPK